MASFEISSSCVWPIGKNSAARIGLVSVPLRSVAAFSARYSVDRKAILNEMKKFHHARNSLATGVTGVYSPAPVVFLGWVEVPPLHTMWYPHFLLPCIFMYDDLCAGWRELVAIKIKWSF